MAEERAIVAVVGAACRFPGAPDLTTFWASIDESRDATGEVAPGRWTASRRPGILRGGFLDAIEDFDAAAFGMSPTQAAQTDPQHRLLLEVAVEAVEDARLGPADLAEHDVGVYVGIGASEYDARCARPGAEDPPYADLGNGSSFAAGRIASLLGLGGPAIAIDTAGSSALVALDRALADLRSGACAIAVVGAVNLLVDPRTTARLERRGVLSPDGRCKPFDRAADGYGRSEGAGAVVVCTQALARDLGLRARALALGSAVNHDAGENGLAAPSQRARVAVVKRALDDAGVAPTDLDALEADGTGAPDGDAVELAALAETFGDRTRPLAIGSAKSNVGHLEVAAGMAGLLKAIGVVERGRALPHRIHHAPVALPRPLCLAGSGLATEADAVPRTVGVSAFGASGTNAHVVIGRADPPDGAREVTAPSLAILAASASCRDALRVLAGRIAALLESADPASYVELARSSTLTRRALPHRLAVITDDPEVARRALARFAADGTAATPMVAGQAPGALRTGVDHGVDDGVDQTGGADVDACPQRAAAEAWCRGGAIDLAEVNGRPALRRALPPTPWQPVRAWIDDDPEGASGPRPLGRVSPEPPRRRAPARGGVAAYRREWQPLAGLPMRTTRRRWILVADGRPGPDRVADALARTLTPRPRVVRIGERDASTVSVDEDTPQSWARALGDLDDVAGVLFLAGLDQRPTFDETGAPAPDSASDVVRVAWIAARCARALLESAPPSRATSERMRLLLVSRGAVACTAEERVDPTQAALWGLGATLAEEHPELGVGTVDLDPTDPLRGLAAILSASLPEDQVALRGEAALVPRLRSAATAATAATTAVGPRFGPHTGPVLVTGGHSALGLHLAEALAEDGVRDIWLTSRYAPDAEAAARIRALRSRGVAVESFPLDPADRSQVRRFAAEHAPGGWIHAACEVDDGLALHLTSERLLTAMRPRVHGALELAAALDLDRLSSVALCSSASGLLGAPGQANQAAASTWLDAFAEALRLRGVPAVSVALGSLAEARIPLREAARRVLGAPPGPSPVAVIDLDLTDLAARHRIRPILLGLARPDAPFVEVPPLTALSAATTGPALPAERLFGPSASDDVPPLPLIVQLALATAVFGTLGLVWFVL